MSAPKCSVEHCQTPSKSRGYCSKHYQRVLKHGDPHKVNPRGPQKGVTYEVYTSDICSVVGCIGERTGSGYCHKHYQRVLRHGDHTVAPGSPAYRIMNKVDETGSGCWTFTGSNDGRGYGQVHINGKTSRPHRFMYEYFCGPIPEGLEIDHLCRNTMCCNPWYLEPVTGAENKRSAAVARKAEKVAT